MFNQRGTVLISLPVLLLLIIVAGVSYYLGSQNVFKSLVSNQQPISSESAQPITTDTPQPTPEPTITPAKSSPPTPVPTNPSNNTTDLNKPTSIKVTSPNGGESYKVGDTISITWDSNNLTKSGSCVVTLRYEDGSKSTAWFPVNTPQGSTTWTLSAETALKKAKVNIECYDSNQTRVEDTSDNFFTIN